MTSQCAMIDFVYMSPRNAVHDRSVSEFARVQPSPTSAGDASNWRNLPFTEAVVKASGCSGSGLPPMVGVVGTCFTGVNAVSFLAGGRFSLLVRRNEKLNIKKSKQVWLVSDREENENGAQLECGVALSVAANVVDVVVFIVEVRHLQKLGRA